MYPLAHASRLGSQGLGLNAAILDGFVLLHTGRLKNDA